MFKNAEIGDQVYSLDFGWSRIVGRVDELGVSTPIMLRSECVDERVFCMTTCGRLMHFSKHPTVFWDPPPDTSKVWVVSMPMLGWDSVIGVYSGDYPLERLMKVFSPEDYEFERREVEATADEHIDE